MKFLIILALLPLLSQAVYKRLEWSDCGSKAVDIENVELSPMPLLQPGNAQLTFEADFSRAMEGPLKTDLKIVRSVNGLALPIRCYQAAGIFVGSCTYNDLCTIIQNLLPNNFNPNVCAPELAEFGIKCTCPFGLKLILDLNRFLSSKMIGS
jgi:hypothetical protein